MSPTRLEVQKEYDALYRLKPNKWGTPDRSEFMMRTMSVYLPNPQEVVDVGCGNGVTLETYRRYNPATKLYGIDPSKEGIRLAKLRVPDGIFTTETEFEDIKQFDLVLCLGVAEHVEELSDFLKYLKAMVKPNGFCYFEVPHNLAYSKGPKTYRRLTVGSKQIEWHLLSTQWENLLIDAGFIVIDRVKGLNVTWEFIWILQ